MEFNEYEAFIQKVARYYEAKGQEATPQLIEQAKNKIIKTYQKQYLSILKEFVKETNNTLGLGTTPTQTDLGGLLIQMEARLEELNNGLKTNTLTGLKEAYLTAHVTHAKAVNDALTLLQLAEEVPYALLNHSRFETMALDTMEDLSMANAHAIQQLKRVVREIFQEQLVLATLGETTNKDVVKAIQDRLTKKAIEQKITKTGLVGMVDKGGKRWNLKTYIEMVVDTKLQSCYHEGLKDRGYQTGYDLVQVSEKGSKTPCRYYEGMVLSMTGQTKGYMTYEEAKATGMIFHPNCRHTCYPMTSFDLLHEVDQQRHETRMNQLEAGLERYDRRNKN